MTQHVTTQYAITHGPTARSTRSTGERTSNEHASPRAAQNTDCRSGVVSAALRGVPQAILRGTLVVAWIAFTLMLVPSPGQAQTPVVEAKNAEEEAVLRVNEDGGLLAPGVFDTGVIPAEGPGTRLMWYPAKAAFRAGSVGVNSDGTEWDDANVGDYSVAFGADVTASGLWSTAMGSSTTASGRVSTAIGSQTTAGGNYSTAIGLITTASGVVSTAMGNVATASGNISTAMGANTTASGNTSTAMGSSTTASGFVSTAMGSQTTAGGPYSLAAGRRAVVRPDDDGTFAWADSENADFTSTGPDQFLIRARGGVGIGTNSPNFQLSLGDKLSHTKIALYETSPTNHFGMGVVAGQFSFHLNGPGARYAFYDSDTRDREIVTFQGSGNVTIAGSLTESSDHRLKTDIAPLGPALEKLLALEPVRYRSKNSASRPAGPQLGLIAQEVERVFPELVIRGADGYLSVAYPKLTAVLLGGLQEQQDRIDGQQAQIETLNARLASLEQSALEQGGSSQTFASMAGPVGAAALVILALLGGLTLWLRHKPFAWPVILLAMAAGAMSLGTPPAAAQTITVQNGATLHVTGGGVLDLHGSTLDLGDTGETAHLTETDGGRVTGGLLTATRSLSAPSNVNVAGLGAIITSGQVLGATIITRGHDIQTGGQNQSIQRYYDITPSTNSGLSATLVIRYADPELGPLPESELEFYRSTDGGATWQRRGADSRAPDANTVTLSGIHAFSRWTLGASSRPLPVELTAFEAALDGKDAVRLTWTTASETNNSGFHIERANAEDNEGADAFASNDAVVWQAVGFVEGSGTTSDARSYRYRDAALPFGSGELRYRLRQVDLEGTTSLSPEVVVALSSPERVVLHTPYPNPLAGQATVRYELPQAARVQLAVYNALGQRMAMLVDEEQASGRKELALEAWRWPSGVYFVRLEVGGAAYTRKLTVIR